MISVVIPVYNVESYLIACLESIINQTYDNWELIVVDDGSTDNSLIICQEYASKDKRIRLVTQKNGGLSAARNTGIELAKGEYITFVDSDDMIEKDMLAYLYYLISDTDMSVCQSIRITECGDKLPIKIRAKERLILGNLQCMKEFLEASDIDTVAWGKLYRTKYFKSVKYPYGRYHEDIFTTYRIVAQCERIAVGREAKYLYRQRTSSITKASFSIQHLDAVIGSIERAEYIKEYYTSLQTYAYSKIIYSANQCTLKLAKARYYDKKTIDFLQEQYRKYETDFLKGNSKFLAKVFSVFAWFNLKAVVHIVGGLP